MNAHPVISVVMAVRDGAEFLAESLESVLGQTFSNFELIAIDDASSDSTAAILQRYASGDRRLRIYRQERPGLAAALNRGMELARGRYIARMDADDIAYADRFERQLEVLDRRPELAVLGSAYELIGAAGRSGGVVRLPEEAAAVQTMLESVNCLAHPTIMARRSVLIETGGYRGQFLHAEDYDLWLRIAERHGLANLGEPLLRYRFHPQQVSARNARRQAVSALAARFAARQRRRKNIDPFADAGTITEEALLREGIAQEEIERAVWSRQAQHAETAAQVGEREAYRAFVDGAAGASAHDPHERESCRPPQVSVIVPCYNQGEFLPDALDSVLAQSCQHWECIIVNDGSTDCTGEIAARYAVKDRRFRTIEQDNQGVGAARNAGLGASRGRHIQFLDADDALFPDKISSQLALLEPENTPALAFCDYYRTSDARLASLAVEVFCEPRLETPSALLDFASRWEAALSIPVHCFLFDRRLFTERGIFFDPALPTHEDWDCWMRILRTGPVIRHVPRKLAVYRRHSKSACNDRALMISGFVQAIDKQIGLCAGDKALRRALRRQLRRVQRGYSADRGKQLCNLPAVWAKKVLRRSVPWRLQRMIARLSNERSADKFA